MKYLIALLMPLASYGSEIVVNVEAGSLLKDQKFIAGGGFVIKDKLVPGLLSSQFSIGVMADKFGAGQYIVMEPSLTVKLENFLITPKFSAMHLNGANHFVASTLVEVKLK